MTDVKSFRDLLVWQKATDLAVNIYRMVERLPPSQQTVLGNQMRRSALSIPSNIAEGCSRHSTASYIHHLRIAHGSGCELETQIEIGRRVALLRDDQAAPLVDDAQEVGRMINGLARSLKRKLEQQRKKAKGMSDEP